LKHRFVLNIAAYLLVTALFSTALIVGCGENSAPAQPPASGSSGNAGVLPPTATATPPSNEFAVIGQPEPFMLEDLELVGLDGWINSNPLTIADLTASGQVVLLDFWTYTCVNCVRTFPYLSAWHDLYAAHGLTVIGIHSPEFDFEKLPANVRAAAERYEIEYPIALDSEKQTWDKYGNHFWPSKYLIDHTGEVVFRHFGEGGYRETESIIREKLEARGTDLAKVAWSNVQAPERSDGAHTITRELYGGYANSYLSDGLYAGQDAYYESPDAQVDYVDDGTRRHGQYFLQGQWLNTETSITSGQGTEDEFAHLVFEFYATSVNAVLGNVTEGYELIVELDNRPLAHDEAGTDITWDDNGNSIVAIEETRLYQLVELPKFGKYELKLKTNSEGLAVYTVTFGVNEFGP
jgi:thiol-disulfide isomerase/thioredoxin